MIRLIIKTFNALIKNKSYIIIGIIIPAFIVVFFSFEFTGEYKFKVGIVDKDNSYASKEIIRTIYDLEGVQVVEIEEDDYEILLITDQIQMSVTINDDFQNNLLNLDNNEIKIKYTNENNIKEVINTAIDLKCEDLSMIAKMSNKDINIFKEINQNYNDEITKLSLNDIDEEKPNIESSLGVIIFLIFIIAGNISSFLIEDEENKIKIRIFSYRISKLRYYISLIFVFYIMLSLTTLIYYILARIFSIDFGMKNSINFLVVILLLNLIALSWNLCIVIFTRSRHISKIINTLIIISCFVLSGGFWSCYIMPMNLQEIERFIPIRWFYICIENLQKTNSLESINTYLSTMFILSMILFVISFIKIKISREF